MVRKLWAVVLEELPQLPGRLLESAKRRILKAKDRSIRAGRWAMAHPRGALAILVVFGLFCFSVYYFASLTANRALAEERAFWAAAKKLTLEQRSELRNDMVRTGRVPHLLPWWEMDEDRCAAVVWKFVSLLTNVELNHGTNGAAWMLRKQNQSKLRTIKDYTPRFDADGRLGEQLEPIIAEFRDEVLAGLDPDSVYLIGFRYTNTMSAGKIKRDKADINSHVVMMTGSVFFHMFRYGNADPIVADLQEKFFSIKGMQPVWVAQLLGSSGKPFRFLKTNRATPLRQQVYSWRSLKWILALPDWTRGINAVERSLLYWFRNGYEMYPQLPVNPAGRP